MNRLPILAAALLCATVAVAQDKHKGGDTHVPKHGGLVTEGKEIQYELVAKPDSISVYVEDHGKKLSTAGMAGRVTLRKGAERAEAVLTPAGDNKLEAKGAFKVAPGTTAIVAVKRSGQAEETMRFSLK